VDTCCHVNKKGYGVIARTIADRILDAALR
jgi:hypothetical protein